jgi:putative DNA primase/helicase
VTEKWSKLGATLWADSDSIAGTLAEAYLRGLGISLLPGPDVLRFHLAAEHPKLKRELPALIAQVTAGVEPSHNCTWLAADGSGKANIEKAEQRRTLGSSKGGAVRFAEPIDGKPVIVGEGIETTATAMEASGLPGWASLGTSGLGNIEWPGDVREVILLAENDENGANQRALDKVCPVLAEQGLKVRVATPPSGFKDFNDLVNPSKEGGGPGGLVIAKMIIEAAPGMATEARQEREASLAEANVTGLFPCRSCRVPLQSFLRSNRRGLRELRR